jgi:hypothetical protein
MSIQPITDISAVTYFNTTCTISLSHGCALLIRDACVLRGDAAGERALPYTHHVRHCEPRCAAPPNRSLSNRQTIYILADAAVQTTMSRPNTRARAAFGVPMVKWCNGPRRSGYGTYSLLLAR